MEYLILNDNPGLSGCVPLTPFTTISIARTKIDGRCAGASKRNSMHLQQRRAINTHFEALLGVKVEDAMREILKSVVSEVTEQLGSSLEPGQVSKTFLQTHPQGEQRGYCRVSVSLIDGIEYITGIVVTQAGLDLTRLLRLLAQLPQLQVFGCFDCNKASAGLAPAAVANRLPPRLPEVASKNLTSLAFPWCGIGGSIPNKYGNFSQLEELRLDDNQLTGSLPQELANLKQVKVLTLGGNNFTSK